MIENNAHDDLVDSIEALKGVEDSIKEQIQNKDEFLAKDGMWLYRAQKTLRITRDKIREKEHAKGKLRRYFSKIRKEQLELDAKSVRAEQAKLDRSFVRAAKIALDPDTFNKIMVITKQSKQT